ncbi:bifunctional 23S rRNA (guanine(2069)-N(7))-methyltransferase RlmK/23S rRNA (guanine(2445)-N(2))-methyltransferase RlmL [Olsenella urininfantis]|uniref:bifunctional 23S rRNA (guanine(2069)-N(7))-methyltransferase RlmK/23S rRNA (guanine(2445)-N(2))-methyltransferase RlmL n=1 Tax=Olsenella urininfantis TaxID=1871033 RepID=UPI00098779C1|nr:bifunctional 23S rRNA (guanine(2069)-N(7))-methyltransferase RlmK/23S rRNA (guanine(2445)-N(2))-methyltransferase RlmL [Olsenella urininfantis]
MNRVDQGFDREGLEDGEGSLLPFFASCPAGFEQLLSDELASLGLSRIRPLRGQVSFEGPLADAYRACLWSRLASRVVLVLARVGAADADALYEGVSGIAWEDHLALGSSFAVDAHGTNDRLRNTQFVALRSKDAIADRLLSRQGARPLVDVAHPDVSVVVRVSRDHASVGIDLSGAPLFRRGYEPSRSSSRAPFAPLRPDYAAALLAQGGWFRQLRHGAPTLVSVFSGAGTLLVEAAAQALDRAPGLLRAHWGFEGWSGHDAGAWAGLLAEAQERARDQRTDLTLVGVDARAGAEGAALQLLRAAGMDVRPRFASSVSAVGKLGRCEPLVCCDLSWLGEDEVAQEAMALSELAGSGALAKAGLVSLCRGTVADAAVGSAASDSLAVFVGQDKAGIRSWGPGSLLTPRPQIDIPSRTGGAAARLSVFLEGSEQFARRLAKVARQRGRWARQEDVSCYRVYDSDLPEYAVSIDLFEGSELMPSRRGRGRWLQVYEYAAPREVDPSLARERLLDVLAIAPQVLGVDPENVFVRVRSRNRGGSQYAEEASGIRERRSGTGRSTGKLPPLPVGAHLVDEGGLTFEVNFSARLDCGIFLDHRETRSMVREMAKQTKGSKRFLNLFAYTGSASCYAADGGCRHTTTVDMSRPSLNWARRNMERNGFVGPEHEFVQADVIAWVGEQRHTPNRWDLVFCDVPTFSNSKGMRGRSWDVQRDHAELLIGVSRLLTRAGVAVFSCNLRGFRPDTETLAKAGVALEDVTAETIPEDFSRNPKIHHCYLLRRVS